jgi:serine/threonine protein phosphatase PrpC
MNAASTVAGRTHRGRREENQDAFRPYRGDLNDPLVGGLVLDGMGGHLGGREAARSGLVAAFGTLRRSAGLPPVDRLCLAAEAAQDAVVEGRRRPHGAADMGATFLGLLTDNVTAWVAWLGDSPAYLVRANMPARQLTTPHSRLLADGPVVTRFIGRRDAPPDIRTVSVSPGDRLLLCSDGVSDVLDETELAELAADGEAPAAAERLVRASLQRGTTDNVTALLVVIAGAPGAEVNLSRGETQRGLMEHVADWWRRIAQQRGYPQDQPTYSIPLNLRRTASDDYDRQARRDAVERHTHATGQGR